MAANYLSNARKIKPRSLIKRTYDRLLTVNSLIQDVETDLKQLTSVNNYHSHKLEVDLLNSHLNDLNSRRTRLWSWLLHECRSVIIDKDMPTEVVYKMGVYTEQEVVYKDKHYQFIRKTCFPFSSDDLEKDLRLFMSRFGITEQDLLNL